MPENDSQRDWVPRPDPTILTTEQSNRLRAEMQREVQALREVFETRLTANDLALDLLRSTLTKVVSSDQLTQRLNDLREIIGEKLEGTRKEFLEKFASIQNQFNERDTRTDQQSTASTKAIDAAFLAAAAAASKTELNTKETASGLQALFESNIGPLRESVTALTGRVDRGEGGAKGSSDSRTDTRQNVGMMVAVFGGIFGFVGMIGMIITLVISLSHTSLPVAQGAPLTVTVPAQK